MASTSMRLSALAMLLASLARRCGAAAASSALSARMSAARSGVLEEFEAFNAASATVDAEGWQMFMKTAAHSANSLEDRAKHEAIVEAVDDDRAFDTPIGEYFAAKVLENDEVPILREMARQNREWAQRRVGLSAAVASPPRSAPPPASAIV